VEAILRFHYRECVALRCDAARNRDRIVAAARDVFSEAGLGAPLERIAEVAGVGIGTLYRRFPTRDDLVAAAFETKLCAYADAVEAALATDDPWQGFADYVATACELQAADAGMADVLSLTGATHPALRRQLDRGYRGFVKLVDRAQAAGVLRADFVPEDLILVLMGNAGVILGTRDAAPEAWRRFAAYMIEAFRAPGRAALTDPPSRNAMLRAMRRRG